MGTINAKGATYSYGLSAYSYADDSNIVIANSGTITASSGTSYGVHALTIGYNSDVVVENYGRIEAKGTAVDIESNYGAALLENYGHIKGGNLGILISGDGQTGIINHGSITADSLYAIKLVPGSGYGDQGSIVNFGSITGFVKVFGLGGHDQFAFVNEKGACSRLAGRAFWAAATSSTKKGPRCTRLRTPAAPRRLRSQVCIRF
ncbi:MAG: hypothetical protein ACM3MH_00640 [Actinomycetota bacterium]